MTSTMSLIHEREGTTKEGQKEEAWSWGRLVYAITLILLPFSIFSLVSNCPSIYLVSAIYPLIPRLVT